MLYELWGVGRGLGVADILRMLCLNPGAGYMTTCDYTEGWGLPAYACPRGCMCRSTSCFGRERPYSYTLRMRFSVSGLRFSGFGHVSDLTLAPRLLFLVTQPMCPTGPRGFVVIDVDVSLSQGHGLLTLVPIQIVMYIFICNPSSCVVLVAKHRVHLPYVWGEER